MLLQSMSVYLSDALVAIDGVAEGEGLSFADDLVPDDIYRLDPKAPKHMLTLASDGSAAHFIVAESSAVGGAGHAVVLDCCATLMAPDGTTCDILVLVEVADGDAEAVFLLPLSPLTARQDYQLVRVDRHAATRRFAQVACVSFSVGTRITLATGQQVPIEELAAGDRVLTRANGPQTIRWVGQTAMTHAPVLIQKGALHNENTLLVSPEHQLFVYQRQDHLGAGQREVLIKVRHLVNGTTVRQSEPREVVYVQLMFDEHQIVYAEGIAAEALLVTPDAAHAIDPKDSGDQPPYQVHEHLLPQKDAVALLRKALSS